MSLRGLKLIYSYKKQSVHEKDKDKYYGEVKPKHCDVCNLTFDNENIANTVYQRQKWSAYGLMCSIYHEYVCEVCYTHHFGDMHQLTCLRCMTKSERNACVDGPYSTQAHCGYCNTVENHSVIAGMLIKKADAMHRSTIRKQNIPQCACCYDHTTGAFLQCRYCLKLKCTPLPPYRLTGETT